MSIKWGPVVERAREIVETSSTSMTLRAVFYRLTSEGLTPNTVWAYKSLSRTTTDARDDGTFPELDELGRTVDIQHSYAGPYDAIRELMDGYALDRTVGQPHTILVAVEKAAQVTNLWSWFGK